VQKLAEMHDGNVTASSGGTGKGSEFVVSLPLAKRPQTNVAPSQPGCDHVVRTGSRILVVDDNVDTAKGMARLLKLLGNDVQVTHDGKTTLEMARTFQPEFVLLDIGLPIMDGYEVAAMLRKEGHCKNAVIIAVSGYGQEEDRRRSREAGFDHHLVKPVDFDVLTNLLARV
jgi:CheY-like chemotaxis protein